MRGYVAATDYNWFSLLRAIEPPIDEANFWKPGSEATFKALLPGEPIFFKLKRPHNAIAGFGHFAHFSRLPISMAWDLYGIANGARSFGEMRSRLMAIRSRLQMTESHKQDFWIGCILVHEPVFFADSDWVRVPDDFAGPIVQGKGYDLTTGEGQRIWMECLARAPLHLPISPPADEWVPQLIVADRTMPAGYGNPVAVRARLGQRSFRVAILDTYERRCAITNEKTLPALEAAHIRDYSAVQEHSINNGILFRADIHKLFDTGYVTVTPDYRFEVSSRIKEEFSNGRDYYRLHGEPIRLPVTIEHRPLAEALAWHNTERYLS